MNFLRNKRKELILLVICSFVGTALRFYTFDRRSLWMDEIYTFNDSREGFEAQIEFYKTNPTYLHPPLFFLLTHFLYPFTKPERDLRILPVIVGILSIPMIYLLSSLFSKSSALWCACSLAFMVYHISVSQDARAYSLVMFLGMAGLFFLIKYLTSLRKTYLLAAGLIFALLFYTSYTSVPFIASSQILWLYRFPGQDKKPGFPSFLLFISLVIFICLPWLLFLGLNYHGKSLNDPFHTEQSGSFMTITLHMIYDWIPLAPLTASGIALLLLFPIFSKNKGNSAILLSLFLLPTVGVCFLCELLKLTHFLSSRYFISLLPTFLIALYLSMDAIEQRFANLRRYFRLKVLFLILFIASNCVVIPLYYRSEKQDLRGLVTYLKGQVRNGDTVFLESAGNLPGILHYFGIPPGGRHYTATTWKAAGGKIAYRKSFFYQNKQITVYHSDSCCSQYVSDGNRVWIVVGARGAKSIPADAPCVLKGFFDGSFLNFRRFPEDASLYLYLWDPTSAGEKGLEIPMK